MDKTYKIRNFGGDKIALLGLFVVSLIIANMIVVSRTAILLSEPIKLSRSGLSVSMPDGNGWRSDNQWRYSESAFSLRSRFILDTNKLTAEARCIYVPATETFDPQSLFVQKAFDIKGEIVKVDKVSNDSLTFNRAYIEKPEAFLIFIFGTAKLPNNCRLDIEVWQIMNDPGMAEQAFEKIVQNLTFEENLLMPTDPMSRISDKITAKVSKTFSTIPKKI